MKEQLPHTSTYSGYGLTTAVHIAVEIPLLDNIVEKMLTNASRKCKPQRHDEIFLSLKTQIVLPKKECNMIEKMKQIYSFSCSARK